ncbi:MAG TPA: hypothetical protein ACFYD7_03360 [Candidatus Wujingus californicus]|uniref:hypothetical protein n=1 Tax=Candidatus Wujingus californicus TaxID=3367618 RepID=UPI001DC3A2C1|nr:hypothetical protein [Planctomycetota bacterium]MDO8132398.1 hypothetical protein [Candidatus Brocadiales bacterium]
MLLVQNYEIDNWLICFFTRANNLYNKKLFASPNPSALASHPSMVGTLAAPF